MEQGRASGGSGGVIDEDGAADFCGRLWPGPRRPCRGGSPCPTVQRGQALGAIRRPAVIAFAELAGLAGSAVSLVLWWPQAMLVWRSRGDPERLRGVSVASQVLLLLNAVIWGAYAVSTQSLWVGAPGLVNAPLAVLTVGVLRKAHRHPEPLTLRRQTGTGPHPMGPPAGSPHHSR